MGETDPLKPEGDVPESAGRAVGLLDLPVHPVELPAPHAVEDRLVQPVPLPDAHPVIVDPQTENQDQTRHDKRGEKNWQRNTKHIGNLLPQTVSGGNLEMRRGSLRKGKSPVPGTLKGFFPVSRPDPGHRATARPYLLYTGFPIFSVMGHLFSNPRGRHARKHAALRKR